jgi:hypothetical protein
MKELLEVEGPGITDQELQEIVLAVHDQRHATERRPVQPARVHAHGDRQTLF